jgi:hypothetical protein
MSKLAASLLTSTHLAPPTQAPPDVDDDGGNASEADQLVPDPTVCREFGVSAMTLWRWDRDPQLAKLGWPPPIEIRKRKFRLRSRLEAFKNTMFRRAVTARNAEA